MRLDIPLARYESAVWDHPRKPGEGAMTYCARIAELAAGTHLAAPLQDMPAARLPYRDPE